MSNDDFRAHKHGSPHDRGMADSYYRRGRVPHKMVGNQSVPLTPDSPEWLEYMAGYTLNERLENHKDWGIEHA
jgi:hypothetical protein